jgi:chromosome segregation ATPase
MNENSNREMGQIEANINHINESLTEMKGQLTPLTTLVAQHESRLDGVDKELGALWRWKDGALLRACTLVTAAGVIIGGIVWVVTRIG